MKKILSMLFVVVASIFCFNLTDVYAKKCAYGEGTGNSWNKMLTINLKKDNVFVVEESPFLTNSNSDGGISIEHASTDSGGVYKTSGDKEFGIEYNYGANINWNPLEDASIYFNVSLVMGSIIIELITRYLSLNFKLPQYTFSIHPSNLSIYLLQEYS